MKAFIKFLALILIVNFIFSLCSCHKMPLTIQIEDTTSIAAIDGIEKPAPENVELENDSTRVNYTTITEKTISKSDYYVKTDFLMGYNSLRSDIEKKCYVRLMTNVYCISDKKDDKGRYMIPVVRICDTTLEEKEIRLIIQAIILDNPQVFWIMNMFAYRYEINDTIIQLYSNLDAETVQNSLDKVNSKLSEIIAGIPGGLSEYEREKLVHDYLIDNCSYADEITKIDDSWAEFTIYGALINNRAVCQGYATAMQILLRHLGIVSITVTGYGSDDSYLHMWNLVKIDGLWYHVDVTWNDNGEAMRYDYFNLSDELIYKDHKISKTYGELTDDEICGKGTKSSPVNFNMFKINCNSDDANYYVKECLVINEFNSETDIQAITRLGNSASSNQEYFHIKIGDSLDYDDSVNKLFYESPYKFLYYIEEANKISAIQFDLSDISIFKKEGINVITLKLSYVD